MHNGFDLWEDCLGIVRLHESATLRSAICCAISQYRNVAISQNEIITVIKIAQKRELRNSAKCISQKSQKRISQKAQNRKSAESQKCRITKAQNCKSAELIRAQNIFINHFCFLRYVICDQCVLYRLFCYGCAILFQEKFYYNLS